MKLPIYLDYQATTPLDPRVLEAMMPYLTEVFGNAASRNHAFGWAAEAAVDSARESIAKAIGASAKEIIFTSGATESNNLAILGAAEMYAEKGKHVITVVTEHKAVLDPCKHLETQGYEVTWLGVDRQGFIDMTALEQAIREDTILISVMAANNEIGVLQDIRRVGEIAKARGVLFHTDGTQAVGKVPVDVDALGVDMLSMSGHKVYGPKGVGALYVRRKKPRVRLAPILHGGGHERGFRSGTLNVPGIVGLATAIDLCVAEMETEQSRLRALRQRLYDGITRKLPEVHINGTLDADRSLAGCLNLSFAFVEGESMIMGMKDIAVSSGSACTSASLEPSYVLKALGVGDDLAHSSIRFGLGRPTTEEEIDHTIELVVSVVTRLREMSPLYEMWKEGVDLKDVKWQAH